MVPSRRIDGILLLYHHPPTVNAPTILEHVDAFQRHSRFPVFLVNTNLGFPRALDRCDFRVIVLHYSLFGTARYCLNPRFLNYLEARGESYKVAYFQDEHQHCAQRFSFIDRYDIHAVYTLLEPAYHEVVYGDHCRASVIRRTLTGYVSEALVRRARRLRTSDAERSIDIGYRARKLPYWMGRGAQEKHEIAREVLDRAWTMNLRLDIATGEGSRIYGDAWYRFVANCRGMLGVEAGTSVFDLDDSARIRTAELLHEEPNLDFEDVAQRILNEYEGKIPYRTISPRHFEAAAFRVVQILFPGRYSGVLEQGRHYLRLERDLSNFEEVIEGFRDPRVRVEITDRAYEDLIASGRYSYERFVHSFDEDIVSFGIPGKMSEVDRHDIDQAIGRSYPVTRYLARPKRFLQTARFPGRSRALAVYRALRRRSTSDR